MACFSVRSSFSNSINRSRRETARGVVVERESEMEGVAGACRLNAECTGSEGDGALERGNGDFNGLLARVEARTEEGVAVVTGEVAVVTGEVAVGVKIEDDDAVICLGVGDDGGQDIGEDDRAKKLDDLLSSTAGCIVVNFGEATRTGEV